MFKNKSTLVGAVLISALALSACQPKLEQKKQDQEIDQTSASETQDPKLSLEGNTEKLVLEMPDCDGNRCPDFSVDRLHTNQFVVDNIIDQAILKNLDHILDISNQSKKIQAEKEKNKSNQKDPDQVASSTVMANKIANTPAQELSLKVQPYLTAFLALDKELKTLGASGKINVMVSPKILNSEGPLATVVLNSSSYLGGAHGSSSQTYFNFDLKHQRQVELDGIIQPNQKANLNKIAYEAFKVWVMESKLADNMAEYEQVWKFKLSDNFYLGKQGLILQYGEYEIGPYVVGLPRLVIPYDQLKTIIKTEYLPADVQVDQPASTVVATEAKAKS